MTDANLDTVAAAKLGYYAPHVILETLDSDTPNVRHVVGINEDRDLQHIVIDEGDLQAIPRRAKGTRNVADVESFIAELGRRPLTDVGTMWGNAQRGELSAIYNDHDTVESTLGGWRDDVLRLSLQPDADWVAWEKISGRHYPQLEFGDIVEELRHTIQSPDQADLLLIIDSIRSSIKGEFNSGIDRANGSQTVTYKKEVSARAGSVGRELEVPEHIILSLRPWEGHPKLYEVPAYFRLNVTEGELRLAIKLFPTREIVRQAWADLTVQIVEAVGKPVYAQP